MRFVLILLLFFPTVQKKKKRCTQEECFSLKHPALLITTTFVWSDTFVYCLFFALYLHVMTQAKEDSDEDRDVAENQTLITKYN